MKRQREIILDLDDEDIPVDFATAKVDLLTGEVRLEIISVKDDYLNMLREQALEQEKDLRIEREIDSDLEKKWLISKGL